MLPLLAAIAIVLAAPVAALWLLGSRTPVDTETSFDAASIGDDLDAYLARREAMVSGIRPGLGKQIAWADPERRGRTRIAIVYIHGFSASPGEVRPLPDIVARKLGANLYLARLTGHGATSEAMGTLSVKAMVNDLAEAIAIGERLGEKVVIVASSSGAALASWGLTRPEFRDRIAAAVFLSPNYGVLAFGSSLLTMLGARELARILFGPTRSFEPSNDLHARLWTNAYPVEALLPMAEMVRLAVHAPVEQARTPVLFLISPDDTVVDPRITRRIAARWGAPHRLVEVEGVEDPSRHVLAGDAMSPSTTEPLAKLMTGWLRETLGLAS
ncbi:MAG TPA: alpha/beta hydrolase [Rhizobiales bacterium]|nr:alpha/beta hydrolase [Hyphomicrobiales bacterium]